jgi:hypothetical protein
MKTDAVNLLWPLPGGGVGEALSEVPQRASVQPAQPARYHRVVRSYFDNIAQTLR